LLVLFYLTGAVILTAAALAISRSNAVHGLLYLVVALLGTALVFFMLGAPFAAALEIIIYAGAIMVLFLFTVMMLNLGRESVRRERLLVRPRHWLGPALLSATLLVLLGAVVLRPLATGAAGGLEARMIGRALFGPYLLGVEIASLLLLAALVAGYHVARRFPGPARGSGENTPTTGGSR
jgi:NADH-quinone oxidoreductase subunit J